MELSNWAEVSVTTVDVTNMHVMGYQAESQFYYLNDVAPPAVSNLFLRYTRQIPYSIWQQLYGT